MCKPAVTYEKLVSYERPVVVGMACPFVCMSNDNHTQSELSQRAKRVLKGLLFVCVRSRRRAYGRSLELSPLLPLHPPLTLIGRF